MPSAKLDRRRTGAHALTDLISAGMAEGRPSGSILILLALHRPAMQPSHLPTIPIQRHIPCRGCSHLFHHQKPSTPAPPVCRAVSARCQLRWRGDPRGAHIVSGQGQGCKSMCSDPEAKVSNGLFPATLHLQPLVVAQAVRNCPCQVSDPEEPCTMCGLMMGRTSSMPCP